MALVKSIAFTILLILLQEGLGSKRVKRTEDYEINHDNSEHQLNKRHDYRQANHKIRRDASSDCPPSPGHGALQVKSDEVDVLLTNTNQSTDDKLRFMCGYTQIMKRVPVSWQMQTQENGLTKNVTFYTTTPRLVPVCCPGYIRDFNDICIPKCKGGCKDGICVSPANCACYQGYGENKEGECVLTCPCECPHGKCTGDACTCDTGYALDPLSQTCNPVCNNGCVNAECTAPGVCTCFPGYKKNDTDNICSLDCGTGCGHGKCIATYVCECNEGNQICYNATCSASNTCTCISGFVKVSPLTCVPECNPPCKNADCVAPNQCHCHMNYKRSSHRRHICVRYPSTWSPDGQSSS